MFLVGPGDRRWPMTRQASGMRTNDLVVAIGCRPTTGAITFRLIRQKKTQFSLPAFANNYGISERTYKPYCVYDSDFGRGLLGEKELSDGATFLALAFFTASSRVGGL